MGLSNGILSNCLLCSWNKGCFFFSFVICIHCSMWLLFQILWSSIVLEINCFGCPFYNICPLLKVIEETRFAWTSYLKWKTRIDSEWLMGIDQFSAYPWGSLKYRACGQSRVQLERLCLVGRLLLWARNTGKCGRRRPCIFFGRFGRREIV